MTRVFRIVLDVNHYQYFLSEVEDDDRLFLMGCEPQAKSWDPPAVFIYKPKLKKGDFFSFYSCILITNPHATEVLRNFFEMAGELLPLPYQGESYTLLNVTECINCLDQNRTIWDYGDVSGEKIGIKKYVFHPDRFSESVLFKIPETSKAEILAVEGLKDPEDEFRYVVKHAGLKGIEFELLWEE